MAYRAEIEIAVKGARDLTQFQGKLKATALEVEQLNKFLKAFSQDAEGIPRSIANLNRQLNEASNAFNDVALGTKEARTAAVDYLAATRNLNAGLKERAALLAEVAENERKVKLASAGIRERTQYSGPIGPGQASATALSSRLPPRSRFFGGTQYSGPIGPGPVSSTALSSRLPAFIGPLEATSTQKQAAITQGVKDMEAVYESLQKLQERRLSDLNKELQIHGATKAEISQILQRAKGLTQYTKPLPIPGGVKTEQILAAAAAKRTEALAIEQRIQRTSASTVTQYNLQLSLLQQMAAIGKQISKATEQELVNQRRINREIKVRRGRIAQRRQRDALSSGIIGGAFPLLFGQGAGAAVGGGLGGAAGGLMGGQFGFGLSLVGTALGTAVDTFVANNAKLADSLGDPTAALDALEESGVKVDKALKDNVKNLVETGEAYAAQSLVLEEINRNLGPEAVNLLSAYDAETQKLNDQYQQLSRELNAQLLPALVGTVVVFRQLTQSVTDFFESPLGQGILKGIAINPSTFLIGKQFEFLTQTGREAAAQQSGRAIALDPAVQRAQDEINRKAELKHQKELRRLEKERLASTKRANREMAAAISANLASQSRLADAQISAARRLESIAMSEFSTAREITRLKEEQREITEKSAQLNRTRLETVQSELKNLDDVFEARKADLYTQEGAEIVQAKSANHISLIAEKYDLIRENLYDQRVVQEENLRLEEQRLLKLGTIARISAAAGFQVSPNLPGAFGAAGLPGGASGILSGAAGPSFESGAELNAIVKQEIALERVLEKYQEIGQAAQLTSELVTTGFQDMLTGTKSAEEVFANFLRNLAEMLIKTAQQMIAQYIAIGIARAFALGQSPAVGTRASDFNLTGFGDLGSDAGSGISGFLAGAGGSGIAGKANGGPVSTGTPYMVGERGPELFVPNNSGNIVPNHALGGDVNVVVNVTETQTDTRGNGARANQVGNALAAAVQAEIIRQKRPGGLLAN